MALEEQATDMAPELWVPIIDEIKARLGKARSAEEAERLLFENTTTPRLAGEGLGVRGDLADVVFQSIILSDLAGRAEVEAESDETPTVVAAKAGLSFTGLPFEEAIAYLRSLLVMPGEEFAALEDSYKAKAFSIARQSNLDLLEGVKAELVKTLQEGGTLSSFRDGIDAVFDNYGVTRINRNRAELIFRQNIQTAYSVGRYRQMTKPHILAARPYWMYEAVHDARTRPGHRALDGLVFPADHEFWRTHYPPNGYRCRCKVRALSERELMAKGLTVLERLPEHVVDPRTGEIIEDLSPDPGFESNPALSWTP